jgi:hypothetical protein
MYGIENHLMAEREGEKKERERKRMYVCMVVWGGKVCIISYR